MSTQTDPSRRARVTEISERIGRELATSTVLFHQALAVRLGLGVTDLKCLDLLRQREQPLTASNLAELTGLTQGAITGVADRLETAGFVERVRDPDDRRRWELRPLPHRQDEIAALFAPLTDGISDLLAGYGDGDLDLLAAFLAGLGRLIDGQTARLRGEPGERSPTPPQPASRAG